MLRSKDADTPAEKEYSGLEYILDHRSLVGNTNREKEAKRTFHRDFTSVVGKLNIQAK